MYAIRSYYEIARRSRGTPRIANRLLRRVRDFAQIEGDGRVTRELADRALLRLEVDREGFDLMDRTLLLTIIDKFGGGPVGLDTLAAAIGEEKDTIEDVIEPFLIVITSYSIHYTKLYDRQLRSQGPRGKRPAYSPAHEPRRRDAHKGRSSRSSLQNWVAPLGVITSYSIHYTKLYE